MKGVAVRAARALILAAVAVCPARAEVAADSSPIDPSRYPGIGEKEMGQLRWVLNIASQPLDEFRGLEGRNQDDLTSYRYAIAFGAYFLALEQYHKLPVWSEAIQPAFDRLIQKMIRKPVWEYWAQTSRGVPQLEPMGDRPYAEARDHVGHWNVMYSGHVAHMVNLYEMLYRDLRWDAPGSIVFAWSDSERYAYGNHSLVKALHDQMSGNPYHAICCEPNAVFPECNQHPVLAFVLYDHTHGTRLSDVKSLFMDFFLRKRVVDPDTCHTALLYLVKQDRTVSQVENPFGNALAPRPAAPDSPTANGWTGTLMHAWQPDYIQTLYPFWKRAAVIEKADDTAELREESWEPLVRYGFFSMLAGEMGDTTTRDRLLSHADHAFAPVWQDGTFHYPYDPEGGCTNLSDKLFAFARANPPNGVWTMHNAPFDGAHFAEPRLSGVDFPNVLVRRAIYDAGKKALVVSVEPGARKAGTTRLEVRQLDPTRWYAVLVDGKKVGRHKGQATVTLEVGLDMPHDLVLAAQEGAAN